eukprot:CFRG4009T1
MTSLFSKSLPCVAKDGSRVSILRDVLRYGAFSAETPETGKVASKGYLCGANNDEKHLPWPYSNTVRGSVSPAFDGDSDAFIRAHPDQTDRLQRQLKNKVKRCPVCGKNVAFTLPFCNGCGTNILNVEISFTNNVFGGFLYGIAKGPFPFSISLRYEDNSYIVFDDPLALTPYHFNCIPTSIILPDWRYLLLNPKAGLELVREMHSHSSNSVQKCISDEVKERNQTSSSKDENGYDFGISGFNYPPSQFQLHLQHMHPPFLPFQWFQFLENRHFTHNRFFPLEYVVQVLSLNEPYDVSDVTSIEDIIVYYKQRGVDYDIIHAECVNKYRRLHMQFSNYTADSFDYVCVEDTLYVHNDRGFDMIVNPTCSDVVSKDKIVLQNYGRPYTDQGKPSGSYYSFAKQPHEVRDIL